MQLNNWMLPGFLHLWCTYSAVIPCIFWVPPSYVIKIRTSGLIWGTQCWSSSSYVLPGLWEITISLFVPMFVFCRQLYKFVTMREVIIFHHPLSPCPQHLRVQSWPAYMGVMLTEYSGIYFWVNTARFALCTSECIGRAASCLCCTCTLLHVRKHQCAAQTACSHFTLGSCHSLFWTMRNRLMIVLVYL